MTAALRAPVRTLCRHDDAAWTPTGVPGIEVQEFAHEEGRLIVLPQRVAERPDAGGKPTLKLAVAKGRQWWQTLLQHFGEHGPNCDAVAALSASAGPHQLILPSIAWARPSQTSLVDRTPMPQSEAAKFLPDDQTGATG